MKPLDPTLKRTILVDTREQLPWMFDMVDSETGEYYQYEQRRECLKSGDYTLEGLEDYIRIERKTLEDFLLTITRERERWTDELLRLQDGIAHPHVFIEASWSDVQAELYRSHVNPRAVVASVDAFEHDFPAVHFRFCGSRELAERMAVLKFSIIEKRVKKPKRRTA